jgi:hypothetical protein
VNEQGEILFPIEDNLLEPYRKIIKRSKHLREKPEFHEGLIPGEDMADILQIWNFFWSFPKFTGGPSFSKEELYLAFVD